VSAPYKIWSLPTPFDKHGAPVMGTVGATVRHVVVFETAEFKRLLNDHPSLATAQFLLGAYGVEEPA